MNRTDVVNAHEWVSQNAMKVANVHKEELDFIAENLNKGLVVVRLSNGVNMLTSGKARHRKIQLTRIADNYVYRMVEFAYRGNRYRIINI